MGVNEGVGIIGGPLLSATTVVVSGAPCQYFSVCAEGPVLKHSERRSSPRAQQQRPGPSPHSPASPGRTLSAPESPLIPFESASGLLPFSCLYLKMNLQRFVAVSEALKICFQSSSSVEVPRPSPTGKRSFRLHFILQSPDPPMSLSGRPCLLFSSENRYSQMRMPSVSHCDSYILTCVCAHPGPLPFPSSGGGVSLPDKADSSLCALNPISCHLFRSCTPPAGPSFP